LSRASKVDNAQRLAELIVMRVPPGLIQEKRLSRQSKTGIRQKAHL
jgi:hypothetical protein